MSMLSKIAEETNGSVCRVTVENLEGDLEKMI